MAKMNGCNEGMVGKSGSKSTRMDPSNFERNNLAKGGVNAHAGGSESFSHKPGLSKGQNGQGSYRHDKR